MSWTTPVDHTATVVTVNEWNAQMGASGNMAFLKAAVDDLDSTKAESSHSHAESDVTNLTSDLGTRMKAQKDGGTVQGGREKINFITGSNVTLTVADDAGNNRVNVTIAASGSSIPTQSEASGVKSVLTASSQGVKGSYTEMIASTAFAVIGLVVTAGSTGSSYKALVDISTGSGGSEAVKVANLLYITNLNAPVYLPFSIAISTRVAMRASNESDNTQLTLVCSLTTLG